MTYRNIVILTGAGISAESGLGTFRDKDGIWTKYPLEDLATPEGFARNPDFVHGFYNDRRSQAAIARENAGHIALADLERAHLGRGGGFLLVTQNVDGLHEKAGSGVANIVHMHGELNKSRCGACGDIMACSIDLSTELTCHICETIGQMRPHVVWFGEMPLEMDRIEAAIASCDLFLSIGTSGDVYPAAGYAQMAKSLGAWTVELNLEPSSNAALFDEVHLGPASQIVPEWVRTTLEG
ncbi:MAG: NAD-dependent deacylase [Hyphomonadaceae bacterium]